VLRGKLARVFLCRVEEKYSTRTYEYTDFLSHPPVKSHLNVDYFNLLQEAQFGGPQKDN